MKSRAGSFVSFLRSSKKTIFVITLTVAVTLIVSSLISIWLSKNLNLAIPSMGTIRTIGVEGYWDENLTNKTDACNWGMLWPGASKSFTLYLRSISNVERTLCLTSENWTFWDSNNDIVAGPSTQTPFMNLTWNYNNIIVQPGEVLEVTLTLSVDGSSDFVDFLVSNGVRAFSVDIIISTSEQG